MHSQQKLGQSSIGDIAASNMPGQHNLGGVGGHGNASHTNSQFVGGTHHHAHDGASRILSAETINERQQKKLITDVLNEIITTKSAKDQNNEVA